MAEEELEPHLDEGFGDWIPVGEYLDMTVARNDERNIEDELTGAVRFVSSLSCVDGLILATPDLVIKGFGVEIRTRKEVEAIYVAPGPRLRSRTLKRVDPNHYGTRHRSMMRYCFSHPGSVGFVISQDGDIRALTRVGKRLVMWENPKVLDFIKYRRENPEAVSPEEIEAWESVYDP